MPHMKYIAPERVKQKLDELPNSPGCYLMRDAELKVIYVGKALVLRNRVRSYFQPSADHPPRIRQMVNEVQDVTWWVTRTELEALVLENDLIKRYKPRYNVRLKDDKQYPYIKVNWQDDFPKIEIVRKMTKDGARYFGPFTSSRAVGQTLDALRRVFPYLDCDRKIDGHDERPCLYYHLKLCGGPCIGAQPRAEYREIVSGLMDFLEGEIDEVMRRLEDQMEAAATDFQFERAAVYRDRIKAARRIVEQQQWIEHSLINSNSTAIQAKLTCTSRCSMDAVSNKTSERFRRSNIHSRPKLLTYCVLVISTVCVRIFEFSSIGVTDFNRTTMVMSKPVEVTEESVVNQIRR